MILIIDNYDSFSYNLVQFIGVHNPDIKVIRNDEMTAEQVEALCPTHIVLSPGPGYPKNAGICEEIVRKLEGKIPILGVCLGHQAICEAYGAGICHAEQLMHGKQSIVSVDSSQPLFLGLQERLPVARYHSLVADPATIPEELLVIAKDDNGEIMAVKHRRYDTYGLQFHPESILTPDGMQIIQNFLAMKAR